MNFVPADNTETSRCSVHDKPHPASLFDIRDSKAVHITWCCQHEGHTQPCNGLAETCYSVLETVRSTTTTTSQYSRQVGAPA